MASQNERVSQKDQNVALLINGESLQSETRLPVLNPVDHSEVWTYSCATVQDAFQAVEAAQAAFPAWASTNPVRRSEILRKAADMMLERMGELATYMKLETGSSDQFIEFNITTTASQLRDVANRAPSIQGSFPSVENDGRSALVLKEPYGVVVGIAPWNAPYILGTRAVSAALAAGNTLVLKGSEASPRCYHAIIDILHAAGLPNGCLNLIFSSQENAAEVTETLIKHPAVGKINFTGSAAIGRLVAATAGKHLKPVLLELGGKASAIVFDDADLKKAATFCLLGAFLNSGQVCMGTERILVQSSIASAFAQQLGETLREMRQSPDMAPQLISRKAEDRFRALMSDALGQGAIPIEDGVGDRPKDVISPTVLKNVHRGMDIFYAESFGPVATLHTFETEQDATDLANDTEFGLAGAIFTESLGRGLRVARKYTTGAVHINSMSIHDEASLPHGGVKSSGFGRFNSDQGLDEFLRTKIITWEN